MELDPLVFSRRPGAHAVPLVAAIKERGKANSDELLTREYDEVGQEAFGTFILKECGFPFDRGASGSFDAILLHQFFARRRADHHAL